MNFFLSLAAIPKQVGEIWDRWATAILGWDERALAWVSDLRILHRLDGLLVAATYLGYGYLWGILALALILFGGRVDHRNVLIGLGVATIEIVISQGQKYLFWRPRPSFLRRGFHSQFLSPSSFPSNHSTLAFGMAYLIARLYPGWSVALAVYLAAALIGLSRIYLREHFPLDVIGGAALGTFLSRALLPLFLSIF
jgi:undecaprenyl-diphosphatase